MKTELPPYICLIQQYETGVPIPKFASTRRTSHANFGIKGTPATF
jgi:hypothetical protein